MLNTHCHTIMSQLWFLSPHCYIIKAPLLFTYIPFLNPTIPHNHYSPISFANIPRFPNPTSLNTVKWLLWHSNSPWQSTFPIVFVDHSPFIFWLTFGNWRQIHQTLIFTTYISVYTCHTHCKASWQTHIHHMSKTVTLPLSLMYQGGLEKGADMSEKSPLH